MNSISSSYPSKPKFSHALSCIIGLFACVFSGLFIFKVSLHSIMLLALSWVMLNAYLMDTNIDRLKAGIISAIQKSAGVFLIFILIGAIIAAFTISGAIPTLIYYGLALITPQVFLPMSMLLCSVMSLAIGTCWGTIGTVGAALIGLAVFFHVPLPLAAGAIVSGSYFGDKFSPISDTTILSALSTETDLYQHIKGMMYTMIPAYIVSIGIFAIIGHYYVIPSPEFGREVVAVQHLMLQHFHIGGIALVPMGVMLCLSIRKKPAEIAMLVSIWVSLLIAIFFQHVSFTEGLNSLFFGPSIKNTGSVILDAILSRGGMQSMLWSMSLTLLILAAGGLLEAYQFITVLFERLIASIKTPASLVTMTVFTSVICNMLMGEAYLSIILTSRIYGSAYKNMGLNSCVLSNAVEEGATFSTPLIPWTTSGAFIATTLGVMPGDYLFWSIFNWIAPFAFILFVMSNFYGLKMYKSESIAS